MRDLDARLKALISTFDTADEPLADEIRALRRTPPLTAPRGSASRQNSSRNVQRSSQLSLRNIVLRVGRPVLAVVGGIPQIQFADGESEVWRSRLLASSDRLQHASRAVGRIDVTGLPQFEYVGTGWLVERNTIATNRHVAREFGRQIRGRFAFKKGSGARPIRASIDFLEEIGSPERLEFEIVEILHIEDEKGPDFALLRVEETSDGRDLAAPIPLASAPARPAQQIAVIGYPARDRRVPDDQLMQSIFGGVYDKKRLAPGQVTEARSDVVLHDCSTLGGNSGSVLVDLATGEAVGLHFAGRFLETNYAVPAALVAARLEQLRRPKPPGRPPARPHHDPLPPPVVVTAQTIPGGTPPDQEPIVEGVPEDYLGRGGYDPAFVGMRVPLPVVRNTSDVLTFPWNGGQAVELKYEHFSVVMSRGRRLCIFSACNIDGSRPRRFKRPSWRLDPRIPVSQQIREECYGNEPLFARGHMTRREDPIWGEPDEAALGNRDSMHVTNTVPQMQPFNAGIWLALEGYALDHARSDQMRISVFTGPFLRADDPIRQGVAIPRSFWKVLTFVHDETGEVCSTGYTMSQEDFLREEEFVFGRHQTSQTRIATIEQRAGLSFGPLAALDPFDDDEEGVATMLTDPGQIRFRRR
jgi:endonuclease G, mitochondrial